MTVDQHLLHFAYAVGEEVVAHLRPEEVFPLDEESAEPGESAEPEESGERDESGEPASPPTMPAWTIAQITSRLEREEGPAYLLHFRHEAATYLTVAPELAIEGTA